MLGSEGRGVFHQEDSRALGADTGGRDTSLPKKKTGTCRGRGVFDIDASIPPRVELRRDFYWSTKALC